MACLGSKSFIVGERRVIVIKSFIGAVPRLDLQSHLISFMILNPLSDSAVEVGKLSTRFTNFSKFGVSSQ